MPTCEFAEKCLFYKFNNADQNNSSINSFCEDNYHACARFKLYKKFGSEYVPSNLRPAQFQQSVLLAERLALMNLIIYKSANKIEL